MSERPKKKHGFLTVLLILANLAMIAWIAVSFINKDKSEPAYGSSGSYAGTGKPGTANAGTGKPANTSADTPIEISGMVPELSDLDESVFLTSENEPVQSETARPEETQTPAPSKTAEPEPKPEVKPDGEGRRPDYSDFNWYFDEVSYYGVWDDAEMITDLGEITGEWKGYISYDPYNKTGNPCEMLFNTDISVGQKDIEVTCDWYYLKFRNSDEPVYQSDDTVYRGTWDGSSIHAEGSGTMDLERFFSYKGKQYATGVMKDAKGIEAHIALVREG